MKRAPASLPQVASFECSRCETVHQSHDSKIPVGWTQRPGAVWCADCTRLGISSRKIKSAAPTDKVRLRGEVLELLREGAKLMPKGTAATAAWVQRVNTMLADQQRAA